MTTFCTRAVRLSRTCARSRSGKHDNPRVQKTAWLLGLEMERLDLQAPDVTASDSIRAASSSLYAQSKSQRVRAIPRGCGAIFQCRVTEPLPNCCRTK